MTAVDDASLGVTRLLGDRAQKDRLRRAQLR
jgi:hypothetical protein